MKTLITIILLFTVLLYGAMATASNAQDVADIASDKSSPITIVYPLDKVYVERKIIQIIGIVTEEIEELTIQIQSEQSISEETIAIIKNSFYFKVNLRPGINKIKVSVENTMLQSSITVFLKTDSNSADIPSDFRPYFVHISTGLEMDCSRCHNTNYSQVDITNSNCMTEACHLKIGKSQYVHEPVGSGSCIYCHNPHGSTEERFLSKSGTALCFNCHEDKKEELNQKHVHGVITEGGCTVCHDAHESNYKFQLVDAEDNLCSDCHEDENFSQKYKHEPVAAGLCSTCHNPHASENPNQLVATGNDLCFNCHEDVTLNPGRKNIHEPVKQDCLICHEPHSSSNEHLLSMAFKELCFSCHEDIQKIIKTATTKHEPVSESNCSECHEPHSSNYTKLQKANGEELCYLCHKAMEKHIKSSKYLHGPVQEGDCSTCHDPHGSSNPNILIEYFAPTFYNPYSQNLYQLCFDCHDETIAQDKFTTSSTDFRNGNQNLHYTHVNGVKGRNCVSCHDIHASVQQKHIRTQSPFGEGSYTIQYTPTETGGNCVVGCHKPRSYDRIAPVSY